MDELGILFYPYFIVVRNKIARGLIINPILSKYSKKKIRKIKYQLIGEREREIEILIFGDIIIIFFEK